jgi:hypothetical protein
MTDEPLFLPVPLSSAEELLDELAPHRGRNLWGRQDNDNWVFRGQSEAIWSLTPAAQRPPRKEGNVDHPFFPFKVAARQMGALSLADRRGLEDHYVREFAGTAEIKGLEIPWDSPELRDRELAVDMDEHGANFPAIRRYGMFALAQHYGVPTRFLDWTWKPLVAAYFAAVEPHHRLTNGEAAPDGSDGRLAVWALQRECADSVCRYWDPGAIVVTVPTATNPNLHAQGGLFTLVRFCRRQPGPEEDIPLLDVLLQDPIRVLEARKTEGVLPLPMLYKFTLPHKEAGRLLGFLDLYGVNKSTVFPGHRSVVKYMLEGKYRPRVRTDK